MPRPLRWCLFLVGFCLGTAVLVMQIAGPSSDAGTSFGVTSPGLPVAIAGFALFALGLKTKRRPPGFIRCRA